MAYGTGEVEKSELTSNEISKSIIVRFIDWAH
jgi:hypothetical protein